MKKNYTLVLLLLISIISIKGFAQHNDNGDSHHAESKGHHDSHVSRNHIAIVIGGTTNFDHHFTGFTIGLDYEYRFKAANDILGLGLFGEYIAAEGGEIVVGIPVFIHPIAGLKMNIAPIAVFAENHTTHENEMHFGGRLGLGYDIHLGKMSISPVVNLDYASTVALNYGITFGLGF